MLEISEINMWLYLGNIRDLMIVATYVGVKCFFYSTVESMI